MSLRIQYSITTAVAISCPVHELVFLLLDNKEKNIVLLFQDVTLSQWKSANKTAVLRRIILDVVNEFCPRNPSRCSLNFWNESRY